MSTSIEPTHGSGDTVAPWLLYALQLGLELVLLVFSALSVMMTDPCGLGVDEPRICSGSYFAMSLFGYWIVLAVAAIAVPMMILLAGRRDRRRWPWPLAGMATLLVLTVAYVIVVSQ